MLFAAAVVITTLSFANFMPKSYQSAWAVSSTLTLTPMSGPVGTVVTASGSDYVGSMCTLSSSPVGLMVSPTCSISMGILLGGFTVASDAHTGSYTVIVATDVAGEIWSTTFTVASMQSFTNLALSPALGSEGTDVTAYGSSYVGSVCTLSAMPSGLFSSSSCSISAGTLTGSFKVASGSEIGDYLVTVTTDVSGEFGSAVFTVTTTTIASTTVYLTVIGGATETAVDQGTVIRILSNSVISRTVFDSTKGLLNFTVSASSGSYGFFNASLAKTLLHGRPILLIDREENPATVVEDMDFWHVYATYSLGEHEVVIGGSETVPEFPAAVVMMLSTISLVFILTRRIRCNDPSHISP